METVVRLSVEVGAATRTLAGEADSGDRYLVKRLAGGTLIAAVDGLGHGEAAACAATLAVSTLERHAEEPAVALFGLCQEKLLATRGAVMSLAVIHDVDRMMTWLGVGNVEGLLLRADPAAGALGHESLLLRRGVIGSRLPALQPSRLRLAPGDTLIFATDGVRSDFTRSLRRTDRPQQIADRVLARHGKETDDALVVAVRFAEASRS